MSKYCFLQIKTWDQKVQPFLLQFCLITLESKQWIFSVCIQTTKLKPQTRITISFSHRTTDNKLFDNGFSILAPALCSLTQVTTLDLGRNKLTGASAGAVIEIISKMPNLTSFSLGDNHMGEEAICAILNALCNCPKLSILNVSSLFNRINLLFKSSILCFLLLITLRQALMP